MTSASATAQQDSRPPLPADARRRLVAARWSAALAILDREEARRPGPDDRDEVLVDELDPPVDQALARRAARALIEHAAQATLAELRLDPATAPARLADLLDAKIRSEARDGSAGWGSDLPTWRHAADLARRAVRAALRDPGIHDRAARPAARAARLRVLATAYIEGEAGPRRAAPAGPLGDELGGRS